MNKNTILLTIFSVIAIFAFLIGAYVLTSKPQQTDNTVYDELKTTQAGDNTKWAGDKKHVLVEYSDLQCPACKGFHDLIKGNIEGSKDNESITKQITFVYKHYPLTNIHKNAMQASYAAEAAGKQKKFFEMADRMFATQTEWSDDGDPKPHFVNLAKELKLNVDQFNKDMNSKEVKDKVAADQASGDRFQVQATTTFFLDGKKLEITSFDQFVAQLKETGAK